ncbi:putative IQ motif, EF-hand binding, tetratricopeptide-like helical domain superfamily [Plasmopara halstedii]
MPKRSPYSCPSSVSSVNTKTSKPREDFEANKAWLASVLVPIEPKNDLRTPIDPQSESSSSPNTAVQTPVQMTVNNFAQKKMLLPYLDKIEYMNCQLRQRGLLPAESVVKIAKDVLPHAKEIPNQKESETESQRTDSTPTSDKFSVKLLQGRYPRLFKAVVQNRHKKCFQPRRRQINWLLRTIDGIYNALAECVLNKMESEKAEVASVRLKDLSRRRNGHMTSSRCLAMPFFTRTFISHSLGLRQLAEQECMDLMYNIELFCEQYPQVAMFGLFLREIFDHDTLLFFLFIRHELQDEFDLDFSTKEKLAHSSSTSKAKKYIADNLIEFRTHPHIPDGTKQVFFIKKACEIIMQRIFDTCSHQCFDKSSPSASPTLLAHYVIREAFKGQFVKDETRSIISVDTFFTTLINLYRKVPDDITTQFKLQDDGSLSNLIRLRDTVALNSDVDKYIALYTEQERHLRNQKIQLMKMERSDTTDQFRIDRNLLRNQIRLQEQELQHTQKKIQESETLVDNVWKKIIFVKPAQNFIRQHSSQELSTFLFSKDLVSVLGRFEAFVKNLYHNHHIEVKALTFFAVPWKQQMEELKIRMVIRIQRAYRSRQSFYMAKRKAREKRLKTIQEQKFKLLEEKRRQAFFENELKSRKKQKEKTQHELQKRLKNMMRKAQQQEAMEYNAARMKKQVIHVIVQWQAFVVKIKRQRQADKFFLKFKLIKWKLYCSDHHPLTKAAQTLQRNFRHRKERRKFRRAINLRVKRSRMAKRYLLKIQLQVLNKIVNQWMAFTIEQQRHRDVFASIIQTREKRWFDWWLCFITRVKTCRLKAVALIQRQYRGRIARHVFYQLRTRHFKAIEIQRVYRGRNGRVLARKRKELLMIQNNRVISILRRVKNRQVGKYFDIILRYRNQRTRIKEMANSREHVMKKLSIGTWRHFVLMRKQERIELSRHRNHSAFVIQRYFRRYLSHLLLKKTLSFHRAALKIQCVFRGYHGRIVAKCRQRDMRAAICIQTIWRRHRAKMYVAAIRAEKLFVATRNGNYTTVQSALIKQEGYVLDTDGNTLLHHAAAAGHLRLVKLCLRHCMNINQVNKHNQTALHLVFASIPASTSLSEIKARDKRIVLAAYMIDHGAWTEARDKEGLTPFLLCAVLGHSEAIEMLLSYGVDTETRTKLRNLNALQLAVEGNHIATVKVLLESGNFDMGKNGRTTSLLLHVCAARGLIDCVRVLLAHLRRRIQVFGYDVFDQRDLEGYTPLIYAVNNGSLDCTKCFLEANANPNSTDLDGRTPLHFALSFTDLGTREALVNLLIQYDADVNVKDRDGDTPLHVSCVNDERLACTHRLLSSGAFFYANTVGNHPTHIAAHNGAVKTLKLFVDYGGDMNLKNYGGKTPLGMARMNNQQLVVQYITASFAVESTGGKNDVMEECRKGQDNFEKEQSSKEDGTKCQTDRTLSDWTTAVSNAYCMGSLAEWTQYIDAGTGRPFYTSMGPLGDPLYSWEPSVEFKACMGKSWELVQYASILEAHDTQAINEHPYLYHNLVTNEYSTTIPPIDYALLPELVQQSQRITRLRTRDRKLSTNEINTSTMEYLQYNCNFNNEKTQLCDQIRAASKIQRHFRAKRTCALVKMLVYQNRRVVDLQRAFRGQKGRREATNRRIQCSKIIKIQAAYRGYRTRQDEAHGRRLQRELHLQRRLAARSIQRVFRGFMGRKRAYRAKVILRLGSTISLEWELYRKRARIVRTFKAWDELEIYAEFPGVFFYHHRMTHVCSWDQPVPWIDYDREAFEARQQLFYWGYTKRMEQAAHSLQGMWRARVARKSFHMILRAVRLMKTCEQAYLDDPTHVIKLGNYVLYLHTITHDYDRARPLYHQLMRIMTQRGPDIPFVLFSYGLFLHVTLEEDDTVVEEMIQRGKLADPMLIKYKLAFVGFFRQAVLQNPKNAEAHINYAACTHWLYEQYDEATRHYLKALALAPHRKGSLDLFQTMLNRKRRKERTKSTPLERKVEGGGKGKEYFGYWTVNAEQSRAVFESVSLSCRKDFDEMGTS